MYIVRLQSAFKVEIITRGNMIIKAVINVVVIATAIIINAQPSRPLRRK